MAKERARKKIKKKIRKGLQVPLYTLEKMLNADKDLKNREKLIKKSLKNINEIISLLDSL